MRSVIVMIKIIGLIIAVLACFADPMWVRLLLVAVGCTLCTFEITYR